MLIWMRVNACQTLYTYVVDFINPNKENIDFGDNYD